MGDNVCLFERIRREIRGAIEKGEIKPDEKVPSVSAIKATYGVSHITALRALKELALEGSVEFVKGRGYFARPLSERERSKRLTGVVACLTRPSRLTTAHDNFFNDVNQAIQRSLMGEKFQTLCLRGNLGLSERPVTSEELDALLDEALSVEAAVDGFILDERIDDPGVEKLKKGTRKPLVIVNRATQLDVDAVATDNVGGGRQAADLALKMGYDDFLVAVPRWDVVNSHDRATAFVEALRENGVQDKAIVKMEDYDYNPFEASLAVVDRRLKEDAGTKTIVFSPTDVFARTAADHLTEKGFALGGRVGVLGFGAFGYAELRSPRVTTFDVHSERIGTEAGRVLAARVNGRDHGPPRVHPISCSLQLGDTL